MIETDHHKINLCFLCHFAFFMRHWWAAIHFVWTFIYLFIFIQTLSVVCICEALLWTVERTNCNAVHRINIMYEWIVLPSLAQQKPERNEIEMRIETYAWSAERGNEFDGFIYSFFLSLFSSLFSIYFGSCWWWHWFRIRVRTRSSCWELNNCNATFKRFYCDANVVFQPFC